jgi:hypothetical protein
MNNVLMVLSNPTEGEDEAYNDWYTNTHLAEVISIPGFIAAQRFKLTDAQIAGFPSSAHTYLSIYEIEGDPGKAFDQLVDELQSGRMELPASIEQATISPWSFEAVSERVAVAGA